MAAMIEYSPGQRDVALAMRRGLTLRCPNCGKGHLFSSYLKVVDRCEACGEELFHHQADDAPPYFTMLIVGHVIVAGVLSLEIGWHPPIWLHMLIWLPLTVILSLALLPVIKGSIVGLQWANRMHGFASDHDPDAISHY
ncbi:DUF983 domain-containing protein [Labrys monachus]|uniref:Uncharacterized protein (DUF983 family) n=1 Tax=Labrys monachus TaxID=217067 RepID=A0ABU0FEL5_9HYPH|nr:DUF983 domain-containing protein [Labrys monachus]MDQ0393057.1 uncharacterized protein (DUF983 family) [Labrys monachus]